LLFDNALVHSTPKLALVSIDQILDKHLLIYLDLSYFASFRLKKCLVKFEGLYLKVRVVSLAWISHVQDDMAI
jgi:hypothetical protein